jgi:hypothetical protein
MDGNETYISTLISPILPAHNRPLRIQASGVTAGAGRLDHLASVGVKGQPSALSVPAPSPNFSLGDA